MNSGIYSITNVINKKIYIGSSNNIKIGDDIYSRLVEGILEVIAEFYSLNLGEEVKKGKRQALARGFHPGGHAAFGYRLEKIKETKKGKGYKYILFSLLSTFAILIPKNSNIFLTGP